MPSIICGISTLTESVFGNRPSGCVNPPYLDPSTIDTEHLFVFGRILLQTGTLGIHENDIASRKDPKMGAFESLRVGDEYHETDDSSPGSILELPTRVSHTVSTFSYLFSSWSLSFPRLGFLETTGCGYALDRGHRISRCQERTPSTSTPSRGNPDAQSARPQTASATSQWPPMRVSQKEIIL